MKLWLGTSIMLCSFGFFREMRPSEPFAIEYLNGWYNMTSEQATKEVYPLSTYAVPPQLVIIFLITDMLRYKPIIVLSACAGVVLFALSIWTHTVLALQIDQFFYGTFLASEIAYYTYMYAKVDRDRYQIVTGHTRAALLCGKFTAGILGQLFISTGTTNVRTLFYITFGAQVTSLLIAIALPRVDKSLYFYTEHQMIDNKSKSVVKNDASIVTGTSPRTTVNDTEDIQASQIGPKTKFSWQNARRLLLEHFVCAYSNPVIIQWSIWWALVASAQVLVITYVQFLWIEIDPHHESLYNGAVEAIVTLLGAVGAMVAGLTPSDWHKQWHWYTLTLGSLLMGFCLIASAITNSKILSYTMYILYGFVFFFLITIAYATVAEHVSDDSFGLVFGINSLLAQILQSLLALFLLTDAGLGLGPRMQFIVYGGFYFAIAGLYCIAALLIIPSEICFKGTNPAIESIQG